MYAVSVLIVSNPSTIIQNQDIIYVEQNKHTIRNEGWQNIRITVSEYCPDHINAQKIYNLSLYLITIESC